MNSKLHLIIVYVNFFIVYFNYAKPEEISNDSPDERSQGQYGTDWVLFPDDDGFLHFVNMSAQLKNQAPIISQTVHFQLYTRNNPDNYEEIYINDKESEDNSTAFDETSSNFSGKNPLKMLSHGWLSNGNSSTVINMKDAYLKKSDVNVVIIDWSEIADEPTYVYAAERTRDVGRQVGKMARTLMRRYSMNGSMVHLVGHSLGAQIVGYAGRWLFQNDMKVSRVTGLDPARPLFEVPPTDGIKDDDAEFVDIIHTNGGILGEKDAHGVADFFPNGGTQQAGCSGESELFDACSHGRSHEYFTESILSGGFLARQCDSWSAYKAGNCSNNEAMNMGEPCTNIAIGKYFLTTNPTAPYSKEEE